MKNTAKKFLSWGLSPIPIIPIKDNVKRPAVTTWNNETLYSAEECDRIFYGDCAIAVITGKISGGLECIDFDNHNGDAKDIFGSFCKIPEVSEIITSHNLPYEKTQGGGFHLFYRCDKIDSNKKLASSFGLDGKKTTIIETRGTSGYVVVAPTENYKILSGSLERIDTITEEEREIIISYCSGYNQVPVNTVRSYESKSGVSTGDAYNHSGEALSILLSSGWRIDKTNTYLTRPGKKSGISATFGKCKKGDCPLLYVFSSNAEPFNEGESYTPFAIYAFLRCNGDFGQAAKELHERGFGDEKVYVTEPVKEKLNVAMPQVVLEELLEKEEKKKSGGKRPTILDVKDLLGGLYDFRYDVVRNCVESRYKGAILWKEANESNMICEVQSFGLKVGKDLISNLMGSDFIPRYNPFVEYFGQLPKWDGVDHFYDLVQFLDVEDPSYFRTMLEKMFVRTIKCALEDNFYNRTAFVLQSKKQEQGKSMFIRFLNPFGTKYYTDEPLKDDKDCYIALTENFIYNLEEIDDMRGIGIGKIKAILAKSSVTVRHPYGKQKVLSPRRCSFFGSTNMDEFLTDNLNTRWLIFGINNIDFELFKKMNIHDLWSQAFELYKDSSYEWDLTKEEKEKREMNNKRHRQNSIEQDVIIENIERATGEKELLSIPAIINIINVATNGVIKVNLKSSHIFDIMISLGFECVEVCLFGTVIKSFRAKRREKNFVPDQIEEEDLPFKKTNNLFPNEKDTTYYN